MERGAALASDTMQARKYGHDDYVIVEETHGEVAEKWKAYERDSRLSAYGNTPDEAVARLCGQFRQTARRIETECLPKQPHWDHVATGQLTAAGLTWDHARIAVGLMAEHRQLAWMDGVRSGFESGHADGLETTARKQARAARNANG
jgi:hypothetical protein